MEQLITFDIMIQLGGEINLDKEILISLESYFLI